MSFQPVAFGKYELVSRLAAGGMAEIFLARTKSIQGFEKYLVIKRILGHRTADPDFVRMFLDEARVAATLDHPNIVQIYDVGHVDNEYFIAMEYLRGHNLIEIVRAGAKLGYAKPPLEHVVSMLTQTCAGLHYAHEKRDFEGRSLEIVHRDITPQNIVANFDGSVKVVDFGIAKAATREVETMAGTLKGKIGYMSPEQCRGGAVDRRSDIFAVGIILFELTTGKRLYHERSDFDTLKKIIEGPVPSPRDLLPFYPAFLNAIVVRCLQKNPDDRYPTVRDLHADLDAFARDNQLVTGTVPLSQYMERIYADELATHKSADAAAMATAASATLSGSSSASAASSYLGEASRRSMSGISSPLIEARRQHLVMRGLQLTVAFLLLLLGGGVVWWQTRPKQQPQIVQVPAPQLQAAAQPAAPAPSATTAAPATAPAPAAVAAAPLPVAAPAAAAAPAPHPRPVAKPGDGHITVASEPRCELLIDGVPYGQTPIIDIAVAAGKHTIVLLNSSAGVKEMQKVSLREGELWTRSFSFDGGKTHVESSLSQKMLVAATSAPAPSAKAESPKVAAPAAAPVAAPKPIAQAPAPASAPKPVEGAASAARPATVASMMPPQKPKNVNAKSLDNQQLSHAEPHLPAIIHSQMQSMGSSDARFLGKVCVDNGGKVYSVQVVSGIPGADSEIISTMKTWTYKPQPVSVCFMANVNFQIGN